MFEKVHDVSSDLQDSIPV